MSELALRRVNTAFRIPQQRAEQRRLAASVAAHQRDLLAARQARREVLNYRHAIIRFAQIFELERMPSRRTLQLEPDVRTRDAWIRSRMACLA